MNNLGEIIGNGQIGIIRKLDTLGRIVIPKEIRKTIGLKEGDPIEIFISQDNELVLKKYDILSNKTSENLKNQVRAINRMFAQNDIAAQASLYNYKINNILAPENDPSLHLIIRIKEFIARETTSQQDEDLAFFRLQPAGEPLNGILIIDYSQCSEAEKQQVFLAGNTVQNFLDVLKNQN